MKMTDTVLTLMLCFMGGSYMVTGVIAHVERARSERAHRRMVEGVIQKIDDAESFTEIVRSNGLEDF